MGSAVDLKIIMYEGTQKFAMRGKTRVFAGIDKKDVKHYLGGEYKYDGAFANGPKEFLAFAKKLWDKNVME